MNISPPRKHLEAMSAVWTHGPIPADHSRARYRDHDGCDGGVAADRASGGRWSHSSRSWVGQHLYRRRAADRATGERAKSGSGAHAARVRGRNTPVARARGRWRGGSWRFPPAQGGVLSRRKLPGYDTDSSREWGVAELARSLTPRGLDQGRYSPMKRTTRGEGGGSSAMTSRIRAFPDGNAVNRSFEDGAE